MNKLQVDLDEVGRIHLSRAGYCNGIYTLETTEALRVFFQAERDDALGRWRHCEPQICQVLKTHKFLPTQTDTGGQPPALPLDHPTIITENKIWPERRIGGVE